MLKKQTTKIDLMQHMLKITLEYLSGSRINLAATSTSNDVFVWHDAFEHEAFLVGTLCPFPLGDLVSQQFSYESGHLRFTLSFTRTLGLQIQLGEEESQSARIKWIFQQCRGVSVTQTTSGEQQTGLTSVFSSISCTWSVEGRGVPPARNS